mmetsp:Transcript_39021/g.85331  ORF Transcript_39021/g.85331 Transcript_39021/m.85331 type:complete len:212 (-) Transcript_39021:569-1204(-)
MPESGRTTGSMIRSKSMAPGVTAGTYWPATRSSIASTFSGVPPSQCCSERMKVLASFAWSPGRNLSTLGKVRTSLSRLSWKAPPEAAGLPACKVLFRASLICSAKEPRGPPVSFVRSNVPSLLSFMTSGMEGKQRQASRRSRWGATSSTSFSASSCTKMREQTKILASSRSFLSSSTVSGLRISSKRYPTHSAQIGPPDLLICFTAAVIEA